MGASAACCFAPASCGPARPLLTTAPARMLARAPPSRPVEAAQVAPTLEAQWASDVLHLQLHLAAAAVAAAAPPAGAAAALSAAAAAPALSAAGAAAAGAWFPRLLGRAARAAHAHTQAPGLWHVAGAREQVRPHVAHGDAWGTRVRRGVGGRVGGGAQGGG